MLGTIEKEICVGPHEFEEDQETTLSKGTWLGVRNGHSHTRIRRDLLELEFWLS